MFTTSTDKLIICHCRVYSLFWCRKVAKKSMNGGLNLSWLTLWQRFAYLDIQQTQSNIILHLELGFSPPDDFKPLSFFEKNTWVFILLTAQLCYPLHANLVYLLLCADLPSKSGSIFFIFSFVQADLTVPLCYQKIVLVLREAWKCPGASLRMLPLRTHETGLESSIHHFPRKSCDL